MNPASLRRPLIRHPDTPCEAVRSIEVNIVDRGAGALMLRYIVSGDVDKVRVPKMLRPERTDELWRTTCFEAFVKTADHEGYCEFNFAPSSQWAAYQFESYRAGMRPIAEIKPPRILAVGTDGAWELQVLLDLSGAPGLNAGALRLGFSAVIEETDGRISYWAVAHPSGKADFHHADGFALELPKA